MNKRGGGQVSGNYGCRTEKRKKIEKKWRQSKRILGQHPFYRGARGEEREKVQKK